MFVVITRPETGEVMYQRELANDELMDERTFADKYAESLGVSIAEPECYILNCCGDIRVEFRDDPNNSLHIWSGESFYVRDEEY